MSLSSGKEADATPAASVVIHVANWKIPGRHKWVCPQCRCYLSAVAGQLGVVDTWHPVVNWEL